MVPDSVVSHGGFLKRSSGSSQSGSFSNSAKSYHECLHCSSLMVLEYTSVRRDSALAACDSPHPNLPFEGKIYTNFLNSDRLELNEFL